MLKKITEDLIAWCKNNYINLVQENERLFDIPEFGKLYLLLPQDNQLLDQEMMFVMDDEELLMLRTNVGNFNYFVFTFGHQFYYCRPVLKTDSYNEDRFSVDFTDLKYIGKATTQFEVNVPHIGIHTEYEILNGNGLKNYIKKSKFFGNKIAGLCDKNTLAGVLAFQTECKDNDIRPVIGMTVDVATNWDPAKPDAIPITYELKLYVTNHKGWQNLLQINRAINVTYSKFIPEKKLLSHAEGLVAVAGVNSNIPWDKPNVASGWEFNNFEKFYFQLSFTEWHDQTIDLKCLNTINEYLRSGLCKLCPPILLYDVYYCDREMAVVKDYLNKVAKRATDYSEDQWFKSYDEICDQGKVLFSTEANFYGLLSDAVKGLKDLTDMCRFEIETGKSKLPIYEFVKGKSNLDFFKDLLKAGFRQKITKLAKDQDTYWDRMEMELKVIAGANFVDYFLILWDVVNWAKANNIMVGPGRGSVAGSLLAYLLDITEVDPIEYNLSFERFINAARVSGERAKSADALPDVDLDFESKYRDHVKAYISTRFGELNTCSIGTYTNFQLRGGIKDFGSVKELSFSYLNFVTADISSQAVDYTFRDFVAYAIRSKILKEFFQLHHEIVDVIKWTLGQPKAASIHASGVMILPKKNEQGETTDIFNWLPIRLMDGKYVSEWEMKWTDKFGALKEDILGLSTLDDFKNILNLIKKNQNKEIDLNHLPLDDSKTYKLFQAGYNENIFQFNREGMKNYSRKVKPDNFEDLIVMNSLWRPGPMDSNAHLDYALYKHGKKKPHYDYGLRQVTEKTQGLLVFQEQMMESLVVLGGFTPVDADIARTQIKKFDTIAMRESETKFIQGAIKNGCPEKEAPKIWNKLLAFSNYAFNRSHSAAYAMIAYQCVHGQTKILDWDNKRYVTIAYAFRNGIKNIACYDEKSGKTVSGRVKEIVRTTGAKNLNKKQGYLLITKSNKHLICSSDHLILTNHGYKKLIDLDENNDLVAAEKRISSAGRQDVKSKLKISGQKFWDNQNKDYKRERMVRALSYWTGDKLSKVNKERWKNMSEKEKYRRIENLIENRGKFKNVFRGYANDGHKVYSFGEYVLDNWLYENKLEHSVQIRVGNGKVSDFYCKGVYIEFDGMNRSKSYFKKKFGFLDLPYVVVTPKNINNFGKVLGFLLEMDEIIKGKKIIFEPIKEIQKMSEYVMYDITMEKEPHNFLANNIVVHNCQWLKANYPLEFWTVSINSAVEEEIPAMLSEMNKLKQNIKIKPPSVNNSDLTFRCDVETNSIYWSLTKIKGLGVNTVRNIIEERQRGVFQDYQDFINRVPKKAVNRGHLEKMILAGAFDDSNDIHNPSERMELLIQHCKLKDCPLPEKVVKSNVNKVYTWILFQKELTGLGTLDYRSLLNSNRTALKTYKVVEDFIKCKDYDFVTVAGRIVDIIKKKTRKGDPFLILKADNNNDLITVLVWSDYIEPNVDFLEQCMGKQVYISGKVRYDTYQNQNAVHLCDESKMGFI